MGLLPSWSDQVASGGPQPSTDYYLTHISLHFNLIHRNKMEYVECTVDRRMELG